METRTLTSEEYTFNAAAKTVTFLVDVVQTEIMIINNLTENATTNTAIYNFACPGFGGTFSGHTLTLEFDTTSMSNTDDLLIVIEDNQQTEIAGTLFSMDLMLKTLGDMSEKMDETNKWLRKIYNPE